MNIQNLRQSFYGLFKNNNYYYFDQKNQLQVRQLNFIQYLFRKMGLLYKETRLKNVVTKAYQLTFRNEHHGFYEVQQTKLLKLMAKAHKKYHSIHNPLYADLHEIPSGYQQKIQVKGGFVFNQNAVNDEPKILEVKIKLNEKVITFKRTESQQILVDFPRDSSTIIQSKIDENLRSIVSNICANTFSPCEFIFVVPKHRDSLSDYSEDSIREQMETYGWEFSHSVDPDTANEKSVFKLSRDMSKWIKSISTVSLDFALKFLKSDA
jgi:hypothetical protein